CPLVLSLQDSWSVATAPTMPPVRSVVETCRTLMSVLYLRIVSVDSADPGIGSLNGVDVDHREICKPSSRSCLLYRELMTLMEAALNKRPGHVQC
ncbi:jg14649, partial [Pararge aegeria aegeria]